MYPQWRALTTLVILFGTGIVPPNTARQDVDATVKSLAEDLAHAISIRDAAGAARHVREDEHVVYVSDGTVIRGAQYRSARCR